MDKNFGDKSRKDIKSSIDAKQQNGSKTYGIRERINAQERESKRLKVSSDPHVLMDSGTEQGHAEGQVDKSPPVSLPQYEWSVLSQQPEASGSSSVDQFDRPLYSPVHPYDFHRFDPGLESVPFADQSDFKLFSPYMYQPGSFTGDLWTFDPGQEGLLFDIPASGQFPLTPSTYQRESLGTGAMSSHELESLGSHSVDAPADVQLSSSDESHYQESPSHTPQIKSESLPFDLVQSPPSELPSDTLADVDKPSLGSKGKSLKVEVPFVGEKPTGIESSLDSSLYLASQSANQLEGKVSQRKAADNRSTEVSSSREADRQATKLDSKVVGACIRHGWRYLQQGDLDEALRAYLRVTDDLDKQNVQALRIVGGIYRRKRQYEEALDVEVRRSKLLPKDPLVFRKCADICEELAGWSMDGYKEVEWWEQAVEYRKRSHELEPGNLLISESYVWVLEKCAKRCEEVAEQCEDKYEKVEWCERAVEYLERNYKIDHENAKTPGNYARVLNVCAESCEEVAKECKDKREEVDWRERALEYRERSIEVRPKDAIALRKCAERYKELGDLYGEINMSYRQIAQYEESVEYFEQSIQRQPKNAITLGNCARVCEKMGDLIKNTSINISCEYYEQDIEKKN